MNAYHLWYTINSQDGGTSIIDAPGRLFCSKHGYYLTKIQPSFLIKRHHSVTNLDKTSTFNGLVFLWHPYKPINHRRQVFALWDLAFLLDYFTVSLHNPNRRQIACRLDSAMDYQCSLKTVEIPTGHENPQGIATYREFSVSNLYSDQPIRKSATSATPHTPRTATRLRLCSSLCFHRDSSNSCL